MSLSRRFTLSKNDRLFSALALARSGSLLLKEEDNPSGSVRSRGKLKARAKWSDEHSALSAASQRSLCGRLKCVMLAST